MMNTTHGIRRISCAISRKRAPWTRAPYLRLVRQCNMLNRVQRLQADTLKMQNDALKNLVAVTKESLDDRDRMRQILGGSKSSEGDGPDDPKWTARKDNKSSKDDVLMTPDVRNHRTWTKIDLNVLIKKCYDESLSLSDLSFEEIAVLNEMNVYGFKRDIDKLKEFVQILHEQCYEAMRLMNFKGCGFGDITGGEDEKPFRDLMKEESSW